MKRFRYIIIFLLGGFFLLPTSNLNAGNEDRAGEAGAGQLLINPWTRSSGWGGVNTSSVRGIESVFSNIAGLAFTNKTELIFSHTKWLYSSVNNNININNFGFSQRVSESGVFGVTFTSITFGNVIRTTTTNPEGGIGEFSPNLMNINVSYAKAFSNNIYGGINVKIINESISNITGSAAAVDAGVQYVTGKNDQTKFGISMKNVGSKMRYSGDGLAMRAFINDQPNKMTIEQRSASMELPSLINIGASYDFLLAREKVSQKTGEGTEEMVYKNVHRLTPAANFRSNSFTKDQYIMGLEYAFKEMLMFRGAFAYEEGLMDDEERTNAETGPSGGFTLEMPMNDKGMTFALDYSYRATEHFDGTHSIGVRINL